MSATDQPRAPRVRRTAPDLLLGILGGGMILLAGLSAIVGGPSDGDGVAATAAAAPAIAVQSPISGSSFAPPLVVDFVPSVQLVRGPSGWMDAGGTLHLHMDLDGQQLMPGPDALVPTGGGGYRWTVPGVASGRHVLRLLWSDAGHRPVREGGSPLVQVEVN